MVDEMIKLREELDRRCVEWIDASESFESLDFFSIDRTHFEYNSHYISVINGLATYGGIQFLTGKNLGLLEMMIDKNEPEGYLTSDEIIKKIFDN